MNKSKCDCGTGWACVLHEMPPIKKEKKPVYCAHMNIEPDLDGPWTKCCICGCSWENGKIPPEDAIIGYLEEE